MACNLASRKAKEVCLCLDCADVHEQCDREARLYLDRADEHLKRSWLYQKLQAVQAQVLWNKYRPKQRLILRHWNIKSLSRTDTLTPSAGFSLEATLYHPV